MTEYNKQIPDLTNKYKKYLGKLEEALNREDKSKLNLYGRKIKMYGMLLQSGGGLDEHLRNIMNQIDQSLENLQQRINVPNINQNIGELKRKFDDLSNKYGESMYNFIEFANRTKTGLETQVIPAIETINVSELLPENVDDIIQVPIFMKAIQNIDLTNLADRETQNKLNILKTFPDEDLRRMITYLRDGNQRFNITGDPNFANNLINALQTPITTTTTAT